MENFGFLTIAWDRGSRGCLFVCGGKNSGAKVGLRDYSESSQASRQHAMLEGMAMLNAATVIKRKSHRSVYDRAFLSGSASGFARESQSYSTVVLQTSMEAGHASHFQKVSEP